MTDKADKPDLDEAALEALFAEARQAAPEPEDDLIARIIADADAVADARVAAPVRAPRPRGWLGGMLAEIGGWPSAAGLAAAAMAGIVFGIATPDALYLLGEGVLGSGGTEAADLMPSYDGLFGEG